MKAVRTTNIHFTPWHLRDRTRGLKRDLEKTVQSNFFYSFIFLPKHKREAIIDVYRFCRSVDDIVDDMAEESPSGRASLIAQAELEKWRAELDNIYAGR